MMDIQPFVAHITRQYPRPAVDPAWVRECVKAFREIGQEPTPDAVLEEYLYSDLSHSTLPPSLLPSSAHRTTLFPHPTLLQLTSLTEVGSSAFQLLTTLDQRRDVLSGATQIRRMAAEEDEQPPEIQLEEGKVPAFQRGMLKLEVSDGKRVMGAVEYRRMDGFTLGETKLGCKVVCRGVQALRGVLLLTPANTQVLGYSVDHLQADHPDTFVASLYHRMGKAPPPPPPSAAPPHQPQQPAAPPPPPSATRAENSGAAARRAALLASDAANNRGRNPGTSAEDEDEDDYEVLPSGTEPRKNGKRRRLDVGVEEEEEDEADMWDDSFLRGLDEVEKAASSGVTRAGRDGGRATGVRRQIAEEEDEADAFDPDESFWGKVDVEAMEIRAVGSSGHGLSQARGGQSSGSSGSNRAAKPGRGRPPAADVEIIEISD